MLYVRRLVRLQGPSKRLQEVRLFLRAFALYSPWITGEHCQGASPVECVAAQLRGFEEDSRSEVVFWIEEWSIESGFTVTSLESSAVECVTAHLHWFEEDSGPEVNLTSSTNPVISMFVCIVQALVSRRTSSRNKCYSVRRSISSRVEEDSSSEVVFWIDELSVERGYHWLMSLMFLTTHLFHFRFAVSEQY